MLTDRYDLVKEAPIAALKSQARLYRHKKTGARVLVLDNEDKNKVFTIGFRTPAPDSTGVPHIIEHTVLCGSKEFPVKDPFIELAKGSLNTFLNAITYPDKTIYPVASVNDKDFQNLMHVYLDAVFYPNIYREKKIFEQEGWHYELENPDDPLTVNGVVYNEMKGAFSSGDEKLERLTLSALFPDTNYANESGGEPARIPDLTYEAYLAFHGRYYHPSNSYIYLYGDMDFEEKLTWIDEAYLSHFDAIAPDSEIPLQKPFPSVAVRRDSYSIAADEDTAQKTYLNYAAVIGESGSPETAVAMEVLDYALLETPGAPLKEALLKAGIGSDISGSYTGSLRQPTFEITARNADASQEEEFVRVIRETLAKLTAEGIDRRSLAAALNLFEFQYLEGNFGAFPKGLLYGIQAFDGWLYDDNAPWTALDAAPVYEALKKKLDTGYFEELIRTELLENPHAALIVLKPEPGMTDREEKETAEKLAAYKKSLTPEEVQQVIAETKALRAYQEEPSSPEDLAKIPLLSRSDIDRSAPAFSNHRGEIGAVPVFWHDYFANGIVYVRLDFDMSALPAEEVSEAALLMQVLGRMDTKAHSYLEWNNEINIVTGGVSCGANIRSRDKADGNGSLYTPKQAASFFEVRMKALKPDLGQGLSLILEMLTETRFDDPKRLFEILEERKSQLLSDLESSGHVTAAGRALAAVTEAANLKDLTGGIGYLRFLESCEGENGSYSEEKMQRLLGELERLAKTLLVNAALTVSVTADADGYAAATGALNPFLASLPAGKPLPKREGLLLCPEKNEGIKTASQVQYVARVGTFAGSDFAYTGALDVLKILMGYDYLWTNLRVKGGAYGCMSRYERNGSVYFVSYRDPHLAETEKVYDGIPEYIEQYDADERDMTKAVIGAIAELDQPLPAEILGDRSMLAYYSGITDADVQKERDEVLSVTVQDIRALAPLIRYVLDQKMIGALGGEARIEENRELFERVIPLRKG